MGEVSLEQVLARAPGGLPLPLGCWLVARVAEALASAPRAVTPAEVRIGERGEVHIAPPRPGRTPFAYLAPEVVKGGDPDERSAVFGLGALLVEAITGRSPFARETEMETRLAVAEDAAPALQGRIADASRDLDAIVERALSKKPAGRFGSMVELAARIDAFLSDELHEADADRLAAAVSAAMRGEDPAEVRAARGFAPIEAAPLGEPKLAMPRTRPTPGAGTIDPARARPTPAPGTIDPARARRTPPPGVIEPASRARPTPPPGSIQPAKRPTPPPGGIRPASKPTPPPGSLEPAARSSSTTPNYEDAELDLGPARPRASHSAKPKLDQDVVRLGDPLVTGAGAGITDAALTGVDQRRTPARSRPAPVLLVDEEAIRKERARPATIAPVEEPEPPGPNWFLRVVVALVALLAIALVYQFVLRPLLK